jgi:RimJ/RimL family protein N-acetyltransferase
MTLRPADAANLPGLTALLRRHEQTSMFPLSNLHEGGLDGPGPHGMAVWLAGTGEGMVGVTRAGMVLPQWPGAADWRALRPALAGRDLAGVLGPAGQVRPLISALGLQTAPRRHDADEPGFVLDLSALAVPPTDGDQLSLPDAAPLDLLAQWRAAYLAEVFATPPEEAARTALADAVRWQEQGSHRVLWRDAQPVAICGFNATPPDVVQVGGVYVPPDLRNRGLARRAVALLLAEARAQGVLRAVLFAASDAAARAYRAIGFQPADPMGLVLFDGQQRVPEWG